MLRCNICGKPATKSIEHIWVVYNIEDADSEEYGERCDLDCAAEDDTDLRCDECYKYLDDTKWEKEHQIEWGEDE